MRWYISFFIFLFVFVVILSLNISAQLTGETVTGEATKPVGMNITVVVSAPTLTLTRPENTTYATNESLLLNYTVSGQQAVWYNLDLGTNNTIASFTYFNTSEGSHTLYLYANNTAGNITSKNVTFRIDMTAPNLTAIASSVTTSSATLTWTTNELANSSVYYGTTQATDLSSSSSSLVTSHSITLTGLSSSTLYYYNVSSCDSVGNCNTSSQYTFTTSTEETPSPPPSGGGGGGVIENKDFSVDKEKIEVKLKQGKTKQQQIGIRNRGNVKLSISLQSPKLKKIVKISEESFDLNVKETKIITLEFTAEEDTKPDTYTEKLIVRGDGIEKEILITIEVETKKPLFDVEVEIPNEFLHVMPGNRLMALISVYRLIGTEKVDVLLEYTIKDFEDNIIVIEQDTRSVEEELIFAKTLVVPEGTAFGNYIFYVKVKYNDEISIASSWFSVTEIAFPKKEYMILTIAIICIIIVLTLILYEISRLKKAMKINEVSLVKAKLIKLKRR